MVIARPFFILGLCLIVYPVIIGKGRVILAFIGHDIFAFFAKLTYGAYMIQLLFAIIMAKSQTQTEFYTMKRWVVKSFILVSLTYSGSFIVSILYESPLIMLLKVCFGGQTKLLRKKRHKDEAVDEKDGVVNEKTINKSIDPN